MLIGITKEIKSNEHRVASSPMGVREIIANGHKVIIEKDAGLSIGYTNEDYKNAGAEIESNVSNIFAKADMIVKVKEPQESECKMLREGQIIFSYLHLAADKKQTELLLASKSIAISYETVTDAQGGLPLLAPMSEIAGKVAVQMSAYYLQKFVGGTGILLGGATGVEPANVTVIGGGIAGINAAIVASGMGADVVILEKSINRIKELNRLFINNGKIKVLMATSQITEEKVVNSDIVVGAVLVPGALAPKVIDKKTIAKMKEGSVLADISIDQGGCFETSRPTTHNNPIYVEEGVIHYCVSNIPAAVAKTATRALETVTLPYVIEIANKGYKEVFRTNQHLLNGLNIYRGNIVYKAVSDAFNFEYVDYKRIAS